MKITTFTLSLLFMIPFMLGTPVIATAEVLDVDIDPNDQLELNESGSDLILINEALAAPPNKLDGALQALAADPTNHLNGVVVDDEGRVMVRAEATETSTTETLRSLLIAAGFDLLGEEDTLLDGWMPIASLSGAEDFPPLKLMSAVPMAETLVGTITSQADVAMAVQHARESLYKVDGKGVKIGIISSTFNILGGMGTSIQNGDLPGSGNPNGYTQPITIVAEGDPAPFSGGLDEGRAIAEVIHDLAPGAELLFHGVIGNTDLVMANAMQALADAGADIIVDDIVPSEALYPTFQDNFAARKVDELTSQGIIYVSSIGNTGLGGRTDRKRFYERPFSAFNVSIGGQSAAWHDFNPNPSVVSPYLDIRFDNATSSDTVLIVQWDEPWQNYCTVTCPPRATEVVFFLRDASTGSIISIKRPDSTTDAVNAIFLSPQVLGGRMRILVTVGYFRNGQPAPGRIRLSVNTRTIDLLNSGIVYDTSSVWGHHNASTNITAGSSSWYNTPEGALLWNDTFAGTTALDGTTVVSVPLPLSPILSHENGPSIIEKNLTGQLVSTASSVGGTEILFDDSGNRLSTPVVRQNPDLVAADGIQNSFFGLFVQNLNTQPFFFGTSAAGPNVAAVAALLVQASKHTLNQEDVRQILTSTAIDMDNPYINGLQQDPADPLFTTGYDYASGYGLVHAEHALTALIATLPLESPDLSSVCKADGKGKFVIQNPNGYGVPVHLDASKDIQFDGQPSSQTDELDYVVAPGDTVFWVPLVASKFATVTMTWENGVDTVVKNGGWDNCN